MNALPEFRSGSRSPRALLEYCLEAVAAHDASVHAFVTLNLDEARAAADRSARRYALGTPLSPVDGCPVAVKDIMATFDMPTQMNSPIYRGWQSGYDAACVAALRAGGAVIIGKTVTTEFAIDRSGPTRNPHDLRRTPGGSSSGSAAAVACGMTPAALGTQTVGSILRPASYCGVVGFKPTHGALHTGGIHQLSSTLDHLGTIASTVDDAWHLAAYLSSAIGSHGGGSLQARTSGHRRGRPPRLLFLRTLGWAETDSATRTAFTALIAGLRRQRIEVADRRDRAVALLEAGLDAHVGGFADILAYEMQWPFGEYLRRHGAPAVGPRIRELLARARDLSQRDYVRRLAERHRWRTTMDRWLSRYDAVVTLASSGPAPRGLRQTGSRTFLSYASWMGLPSLSVPLLHVSPGLPVGVQLIGRTGSDRALCELGNWLSQTVQGPPT